MRTDSVYLRHIIDAIEKIVRYSTVQKETFLIETQRNRFILLLRKQLF
jgi:uncharacterized protein with HEPN domain